KQDYKMAIKKYRKALRYLDMCWEKDGVDQEKSTALRKTKSQIFTNSSLVFAYSCPTPVFSSGQPPCE
ncbi:peptidyl-prolyl cis-trans isomerase CYP40-like, partial [Trifolium medium]|nr:peptidyl-prolyl cis-trans isomerase CYP40-like [Trifolium medium]